MWPLHEGEGMKMDSDWHVENRTTVQHSISHRSGGDVFLQTNCQVLSNSQFIWAALYAVVVEAIRVRKQPPHLEGCILKATPYSLRHRIQSKDAIFLSKLIVCSKLTYGNIWGGHRLNSA